MGNSRHLQCALALAALVIVAIGGISVAQASTGGASSYAGYGGSSPAGEELAFSSPMRSAGASWYGGKSMWGRTTACGETLRPDTLGVAHKTLPCGTTVKFVYHGHVLVTQVIDRGPYVKGRAWDLTEAASKVLGLGGIGRVRYALALTNARR
jgi:peptidoglycan lytic transglycosylase